MSGGAAPLIVAEGGDRVSEPRLNEGPGCGRILGAQFQAEMPGGRQFLRQVAGDPDPVAIVGVGWGDETIRAGEKNGDRQAG